MCNVVSMSFHSHILIENWLIVCSWLSLCSLSCQPGGGPCKYQSRWQTVMKTNFWWDFFFSWKRYVGNNFWKWSGENSCRHIIPEKDVYQTVKRATKRKTLLARPKMHGVVPYQGGKAAAQIRPLAGHRQTLITNTLYGPSLHRKWWWHYVIAKPWLLFNTWIRNDSEDQLKSWFSWIWNDL